MQVVTIGPVKVVGIMVEAGWDELWKVMPEAWNELYRRQNEIRHSVDEVLLDVSFGRSEGGIYTQLIGAEVKNFDVIPAGMVKREIPVHSYIHHRHEDDEKEIARTFGGIYRWAEEQGYKTDELKLDIGYSSGEAKRPHDLYVKIAET